MKSLENQNELLKLKNVGRATLADLSLLGINNISELQKEEPEYLFQKLQVKTGQKQDPCVLDVFSAIIHEAKTGEKLPWWHFSRLRKMNK